MSRSDKLDLLEKYKHNFSEIQQNPMVKKWKEFLRLPYSQQQKIRQEWDQYFKDVRDTIAYARFQDQKQAFKEGDFKRVKELAEEARQQMIDNDYQLKMPDGIDPWEFDFNGDIKRYKWLEGKIRELQWMDNTDLNQMFE